MVVNDLYRFVFIHVPKAAGTSVMSALKALDGNNMELLAQTKHEVLRDFMNNWRARANPSCTANPETYFRFAFVRNPWIRMHSFYTYLVEKRPRPEIDTISSFKDFLLQSGEADSWINGLHSMRPQLDYFQNTAGQLDMDFVGHYEHLLEDLGAIGTRLGLELRIPHLNKSSSATVDYRTCFDAEMIQIVASRFKEDVDRFGYAFDVAPPARRCSGPLRGNR